MSQSGILNSQSASLPSNVAQAYVSNSGTAVPVANILNVLGNGSITTLGSGNTVTVELTGLTNHDVLVGAGTTTITSVSPSTAGFVLTSNGVGADPSFKAPASSSISITGDSGGALTGSGFTFTGDSTGLTFSGAGTTETLGGTLNVAHGGTGDTSFKAFSVITGGATPTGALQNVSGVGTSGQILTSNGAAALPTWQAPASSFTPISVVSVFDDFIGVTFADGVVDSQLSWTQASTGASSYTATVIDNGHPGNLLATSGTDTNTIQALPGLELGGGVVTVIWVFKITTLSTGGNRYVLRMGLGDTVSVSDQTNGVYFEYSDNINSGDWNYKTASASTRTTSNSTTAVTTGWHNATMVINANASSVSFTMDGVSLGAAITTNIPTANIQPLFYIDGTAGSGPGSNNIYVDLFSMNQILTTSR